MTEPFSARLRSATWSDHRSAEQTAFLGDLTNGRLSLAAHAALTAQHYLIYQVLEDAAHAMRTDPVAGRFHNDGLTRLPRLAEDLQFLLGPQWRAEVRPNAATAEYRARLHDIAFTWPAGFVAHHYNRYLGDLSGGQFVAAAIAKAYGLRVGGDGLRFYAFDQIGDLAAFKHNYRAELDEAPWDALEHDRIIDEVKLAYRLNIAVLAELGLPETAVPPSVFTPDVIAQIMKHMNEDHGDDSLLICRAALRRQHGDTAPPTAAVMSGMDAEGIDFRVTIDGIDSLVRVHFAYPLTERSQVRAEVTRLYREACELQGAG